MKDTRYLDKTGLSYFASKIQKLLLAKVDKGDDNKIISSQLPDNVYDVVEFQGIIDDATSEQVGIISWDYVVWVTAKKCFMAVRMEVNSFPSIGGEGNSKVPKYYNTWSGSGVYQSLLQAPYSGKIFIDTTTNRPYRWDGKNLVEVSASLALGETADTAYPGNKGKQLSDDAEAIKEHLEQTDRIVSDAKLKTVRRVTVSSTPSSVTLTSSFLDERSEPESCLFPVASSTNAGIIPAEKMGLVDNLSTNESSRIKAESDRQSAESDRQSAESDRAKAEQTRADDFRQQTEAVSMAIKNCVTATEGAEKVNVELLSDSIRVTDRDGVERELQVTPQELVTVTIQSQVEGLSVEGVKVNVFLNNGKTPQTYTTNAQGEASFAVDKGNYYEVAVPEYATAQPISPVGYTAVVHERKIPLVYKPYDVDTSEKVIVTVTKYTNGTGVKWEGKTVKIAYDGKTTEYQCDKNGQVTTYIPYLKEYTITVDDEDGYLVRFKKNTRAYTARVTQRLVDIIMYQFKTGIFIMDADGEEYYLDEWTAAGKQPDEAVAIKIADQQLQQNRGSFLLRTSDLKDMTKLVTRQWCTQNLQFTSIALNGNTSSDPNYWNGEQSSFLVMQEAKERSLSVPAFEYAKTQTLEIGGQTLEGFLLSVGQEYAHISNAGVVRDILTALFGSSVGEAYYKFMNNTSRWTSTQYSEIFAWYFTSQLIYNGKTYTFRILPSFAC